MTSRSQVISSVGKPQRWRRIPLVLGAVLAALAIVAIGAPVGATPRPVPTAHGVFLPELLGDSCTGPHFCVAVGFYESQGKGSDYLALAEAWNGSAWSLMSIPTPVISGGSGAELLAVSCSAADACVAVGRLLIFHVSTGYYSFSAFSEVRDGSHWRAVLPVTPQGLGAQLFGVSCTAASHCLAVGSDGSPRLASGATLAESWNGSSWQLVHTPPTRTPGGAALQSISCASAISCAAVGYQAYGAGLGRGSALAESWNGTTWTVEPTPLPNAAISSSLYGVSCGAPGCTAVGSIEEARGPFSRTLVESFNGASWSLVASANPKGAGASSLDSASCVTGAPCQATGQWSDSTGENQSTLAESAGPSGWSITRSPSPGSFSDVLASLSCTLTSNCVAVGYYAGIDNQHLLSEVWDGSTWRWVATATP